MLFFRNLFTILGRLNIIFSIADSTTGIFLWYLVRLKRIVAGTAAKVRTVAYMQGAAGAEKCHLKKK